MKIIVHTEYSLLNEVEVKEWLAQMLNHGFTKENAIHFLEGRVVVRVDKNPNGDSHVETKWQLQNETSGIVLTDAEKDVPRGTPQGVILK